MESELHRIRVVPESESNESDLPKCILWCASICCCNLEKKKKDRYMHIQYKPVIDTTILAGTLPPHATADKVFSFPQYRQTVYPVHRRLSSVINEQPRRSRISVPKRPTFSTLTSVSQYPSLPSIREALIKESTEPTLTFSLFYDIQTRVLFVDVKFANNLNNLVPDRVHRKKSDTCVTAFLLPDKNEIMQTYTKFQTDNPIFNHTFQFTGILAGDLRQQTLVFHVLDHKTLIGIVKVELKEADLLGDVICKRIGKSSEMDVEAHFSAGDIQLSLSYHPDIQIIKGVVLRVSNLRQHRLAMSSPHPYVNIYLLYEGEKYAKWKSSVKHDTSVAVFNETFQFNIATMELNLITLGIHVKDYHRLALSHLIGEVEIGSSALCEIGLLHWQEILQSPRQRISRWHTILPLEAQQEIRKQRKTSSSSA